MIISKFGEYPFTEIPEKKGGCDVKGCENPASYWMCSNCGSITCIEHHAVSKGFIVPFCQNCFKDWLKKRKIKSFEQFEKYAVKNLEFIGYQLWESIKKYLEGVENDS